MSKVWISNPNGSGGFYSCECVRDIWPLVNELARKKGVVKNHLDVMQGSYTSAFKGSALTHVGGGVLDIAQTGKVLDDLLEEAGFADYERDSRDGFTPHSHIILRWCTHLHWQAAAQVSSWWKKRNGLVNNAPDRDQTRPSVDRKKAASIEWLKSQLGRGTATVKAAVLAKTVGKGRPISFSRTMENRGKPNFNVKVIQNILARQGKQYYDGPIDGIYGPKMVQGVKRYQQVVYKTTNPKVADGILGWDSFSKLVRWDGWTPVK